MELDVRCFKIIAGFDKPGGEAGGHGHGARARCYVFETDLGLTKQAADLVIQGGFVAFVDQPRLQVVLHVLADTLQVLFNLDTVFGQLVGLADAGQHQQLRRIDRPAGQDNFLARLHCLGGAAAVCVGDAGGNAIRDDNTLNLCVGDDLQIIAGPGRVQIGHCCRAAPPVAGGQLEKANALLVRAVVVGVEFVTCRLRCRDPGIGDGALNTHV